MNREKIVENHITDLKVGLELAELAKNTFLQDYTKNQLETVKTNYNLKFFEDTDLAQAYSVDLVLFIKTSDIIGDSENKYYFMDKLNILCDYFPELRNNENVKEVM